MKRCRWPAVAAVLALAVPSSAAAEDERSKVRAAEARVEALQERMTVLLGQLRDAQEDFAMASGNLGVARLRLERLEERALSAQEAMNDRAREAYKKGVWRSAQLLFGVDGLPMLLSFTQYVGASNRADLRAYREVTAARDALENQRTQIESDRQLLLDSSRRAEDLRLTLQTSLHEAQEALAKERVLLVTLEAARRRTGTVSPAVEARRSARQVILDQRLAALLDWYAPASGAEPFMPPKLRGTGVITTGLSSWYGPGFDGRRASSGATYRMLQTTAASLVLPFGTLLKVSFNGKAVVVVITDRGPYIAGRVLDLSWAAAQAIGLTGVKSVRMEIVLPTVPAPPFP